MSATQLDDSYLILSFFNPRYASSKMRACQTASELKKKYKYVLNNPDIDTLKKDNESILNKKTVIFVYKFSNLPPNYNDILKDPFIIWDIIDGLNGKANAKDRNKVTYDNCEFYKNRYNKYHMINCANSGQMKMLKEKNPLNRIFDCIPHNWDDRMRNLWDKAQKNEKLKKPVFKFLGTSQQKYDKKYKKFNGFSHVASKLVTDKKNFVGTFNVCGSFRTEGYALPKPGTKCAVASSINCVFLANRNEYGVYDLLGDNYPYYFNEPLNDKNIKSTMNYITKTYKKEQWHKAKECMKMAKEKSDVINTTKEFIKHIENHFENK